MSAVAYSVAKAAEACGLSASPLARAPAAGEPGCIVPAR